MAHQIFLLTFLIFGLFGVSKTKEDVLLDLLLPYSLGDHQDPTRTHRHVRDCQLKIHGNLTHESLKPSEISNDVEVKYFYKEFSKHGNQLGHHVVAKNPLEMISVQEPTGKCSEHSTSTVVDSATMDGCVLATNAGFFQPEKNKEKEPYGTCYGNIVSNSRLIQKTGVQNANFGIRKDGTVVIGYLSQDEVMDKENPFVQLVTGVGWVLRNGQKYLEESKQAECKDTQTTGSLKRFFTVQSARTLIGYDDKGHVHLVTVDGRTAKRGINLEEAAEFMLSLGVINAINLDGGGSATFVANSTVINYPSDQRDGSPGILFPRKVSTIICINSRRGEKTTPEHMASLSYCCNRNYLLVIGLTVLIGVSLLLHVHFYSLYKHYRNRVKALAGGQQQKEALQSLLQQTDDYGSSCLESNDEDEDEL